MKLKYVISMHNACEDEFLICRDVTWLGW